MRQERLTEDIQQRDKQGYPAIFVRRKRTNGGFECQSLDISALDIDATTRNNHFETLWSQGGLKFWYNKFADILTNRQEIGRATCRERVCKYGKNPEAPGPLN